MQVTQRTIPTLNLTPESSQIHGYAYEPASSTLYVEFKSNCAECTYAYNGVPAEVGEAMAEAASPGSFVYKQVKPVYSWVRIDKAPPAEEAQAEGSTPD